MVGILPGEGIMAPVDVMLGYLSHRQ